VKAINNGVRSDDENSQVGTIKPTEISTGEGTASNVHITHLMLAHVTSYQNRVCCDWLHALWSDTVCRGYHQSERSRSHSPHVKGNSKSSADRCDMVKTGGHPIRMFWLVTAMANWVTSQSLSSEEMRSDKMRLGEINDTDQQKSTMSEWHVINRCVLEINNQSRHAAGA